MADKPSVVTRIAALWELRQGSEELDQMVQDFALGEGRELRVFRQFTAKGGTVKIIEGRNEVGSIYLTELHLPPVEKAEFTKELARAGHPPPRRRRRASYSEVQCSEDYANLRTRYPQIRGLWYVGWVRLDQDLRGKGFGRVLYQEAIRAASRYKVALGPGVCAGEPTSPDALRLWKVIIQRLPHEGFLVWGG